MLLAFVDTDPLTARDARMVWDVIRQHQAWGDRYADRMRRETVKSLRRSGRKDVAAALVGRMRPVVRSPEVCSGHVVAPRSGMDKMFNVQDCLPIRAARHPCIERCARILVRCTDRVGIKKTITTMLSLYNRLFMRLAPDDDDWSTLQSIPLTKWLEAYDADLRDTRSVSYQHLCVSLRYIGRLYNKIMIENGSDRWHMRTEVPIPLLHEHPMFLGDDNDKNSSLRRQVMRMRVQRCVDNGVPPHEDMTMSACSPQQVRSLIEAAASTHERLVLMILLTTGLRTGGVASLRTVDGVDLQTASEMPRKMVASEKYGVERVVALSDCVRGLVARWVQETRYKRGDTPPNPYLFPRGAGRERRQTQATDDPHPHHQRKRVPYYAGTLQEGRSHGTPTLHAPHTGKTALPGWRPLVREDCQVHRSHGLQSHGHDVLQARQERPGVHGVGCAISGIRLYGLVGTTKHERMEGAHIPHRGPVPLHTGGAQPVEQTLSFFLFRLLALRQT